MSGLFNPQTNHEQIPNISRKMFTGKSKNIHKDFHHLFQSDNKNIIHSKFKSPKSTNAKRFIQDAKTISNNLS